MNALRKQVERIFYGADCLRYHTMHRNRPETVGHHSHGVAALAMLMTTHWQRAEDRLAVLEACLLHDLAEGGRGSVQAAGDMPAPTKRAIPGLREQFGIYEEELMLDSHLVLPPLTPWQERMVKMADATHGLFSCVQEFRTGNQEIVETYETYRNYVAELRPALGTERELFYLAQDMFQEACAGPYGRRHYERKTL